MLSCKKAMELASQDMDRPLAPGERFALGWHLLICRGCRAVRRQFGLLRKMATIYEDKVE